MQLSKRTLIGLFICGLFALILGLWASGHLTSAPSVSTGQLQAGIALKEPRTIHPFQLTTGKNQAFTNQNLQGKWTFLFFGFTHCPMICPTAMASLNQIYLKLQTDKQPLPQIVFISVDPERDTATLTGQYASGFNPHFIGATGDEQQLAKLTQELGVVYLKTVLKGSEPDEADTYAIDHSSTILLINPQGQLAALFSIPHDPEKIVKDYLQLVHHYKG